MKIICCGCKKYIGEKEGPKDAISHSYCIVCEIIAWSCPPTMMLESYEFGEKIAEINITYMPTEKLAILLEAQRQQNRQVRYRIE